MELREEIRKQFPAHIRDAWDNDSQALGNGDDSHELPAASTFVIAPDGTVLFESVSGDYRWRVGPEEVLAALAANAGR